jgi:hypothetical protein
MIAVLTVQVILFYAITAKTIIRPHCELVKLLKEKERNGHFVALATTITAMANVPNSKFISQNLWLH